LFPVVFGVLSILIPSLVFGYTPFDLQVLIQGMFHSFIPSLIGLGIGVLIKKLKNRKNSLKIG